MDEVSFDVCRERAAPQYCGASLAPKEKDPEYFQGLFLLERVAGIEPASPAWKASIIATIRYPRDEMIANLVDFIKTESLGFCYKIFVTSKIAVLR